MSKKIINNHMYNTETAKQLGVMDIITMIFTLQKRLYIKKTLESIF